MKYYISLCLIILITDFSIIMMLNYFCRLYNKKKYLFIAFCFSIIPSVLFVIFKLKYYQLVLFKILFGFIQILFLTDEFSFSKILYLFFMYVFSFFSIYGFLEFFIAFVKVVFFRLFNKNLGLLCDFLVVFALFLYIFGLIIFFNSMLKKRYIQNFLYKVSFLLFGKHIEINGLLDSGNILYDTKTGKAVIIVSLKALKNFVDKKVYFDLLSDNYDDLNISNKVDCFTVGGKSVTIPIFDIDKVVIRQAGQDKPKVCKCVLGITKENFAEKNDYDCLLHREFL